MAIETDPCRMPHDSLRSEGPLRFGWQACAGNAHTCYRLWGSNGMGIGRGWVSGKGFRPCETAPELEHSRTTRYTTTQAPLKGLGGATRHTAPGRKPRKQPAKCLDMLCTADG